MNYRTGRKDHLSGRHSGLQVSCSCLRFGALAMRYDTSSWHLSISEFPSELGYWDSQYVCRLLKLSFVPEDCDELSFSFIQISFWNKISACNRGLMSKTFFTPLNEYACIIKSCGTYNFKSCKRRRKWCTFGKFIQDTVTGGPNTAVADTVMYTRHVTTSCVT